MACDCMVVDMVFLGGREFYRKTVSYALLWCVLSTAILRLSGKLSARMAAAHNSTGKITKEF